MGRCRLVYPEEVRLTLSDGDFIDVKRTLNAGEHRAQVIGQFRDNGDRLVIDHSRIGLVKILAYLLGWSFTGRDNTPLPYSVDQPEEIRIAAIDSLDPETWREMLAAIEAHEAQQDAAIEAKKNAQNTVTSSSPT